MRQVRARGYQRNTCSTLEIPHAIDVVLASGRLDRHRLVVDVLRHRDARGCGRCRVVCADAGVLVIARDPAASERLGVVVAVRVVLVAWRRVRAAAQSLIETTLELRSTKP
jgi:hypothetical protein